MNPLILVVMLLSLMVAPLAAQSLECTADRPCEGLDCFKEHDGPHDWTKGCPNGDLTRCFEIVTPDYNRCNDKNGNCGPQYDPSKGPVCEKDPRGFCKDTALPVDHNADFKKPAPKELVDQFVTKYRGNVDTKNGVVMLGVNKHSLQLTECVLVAEPRARVTSGCRSKDHPIEAAKPNGPGPHTKTEKSPIDFGAISKDGLPTTWRSKNYDREGMQRLIDAITVLDPCATKIFNDPNIIGVKPGRDRHGNVDHIHNNHAHVQWSREDLSAIAQEVSNTGDLTKLNAMVEMLQKERLEPGGIERQKEHYRELAEQCQRNCDLADKYEARRCKAEVEAAKAKFLREQYEAQLRQQNSNPNGSNQSHEIYGDTH